MFLYYHGMPRSSVSLITGKRFNKSPLYSKQIFLHNMLSDTRQNARPCRIVWAMLKCHFLWAALFRNCSFTTRTLICERTQDSTDVSTRRRRKVYEAKCHGSHVALACGLSGFPGWVSVGRGRAQVSGGKDSASQRSLSFHLNRLTDFMYMACRHYVKLGYDHCTTIIFLEQCHATILLAAAHTEHASI